MRCTCPAILGDRDECDTCQAIEATRSRLAADPEVLSGLTAEFPGPTFIALDELAAAAYASDDWTAFTAAYKKAMDDALDTLARAEVEREDAMPMLFPSMQVAA